MIHSKRCDMVGGGSKIAALFFRIDDTYRSPLRHFTIFFSFKKRRRSSQENVTASRLMKKMRMPPFLFLFYHCDVFLHFTATNRGRAGRFTETFSSSLFDGFFCNGWRVYKKVKKGRAGKSKTEKKQPHFAFYVDLVLWTWTCDVYR